MASQQSKPRARDLAPSERTRLRRVHERGHYDRETVAAILDAGALCHVGYVVDGQPYVTPTFHWRDGDNIYWHGSSASRALRASEGADVCLTVTHIDGLVLARSAFHHSANYRSVMVLGKARKLTDREEKLAAMKAFVDKLFPDRWDELRPVTEQEIKATTILSMPLDEASAKVRTGGPVDDEPDYELPIWAGQLPLATVGRDPIPCERLPSGAPGPVDLPSFASDR